MYIMLEDFNPVGLTKQINKYVKKGYSLVGEWRTIQVPEEKFWYTQITVLIPKHFQMMKSEKNEQIKQIQ